MRTAVKRALAVSLALVTAGFLTGPVRAQPAAATCRDVHIPVGLLGLDTMYGRLCEPAVATRTVVLLVPGGSYASTYWDLPAELGLHSFRGGMNDAGYATLTVDRVGSGRSSRPLSATVTTITQAAAVHQAVQRLRSGSLGTRFANVILGGHSLGGAISLIEAATYGDVDALLLAGITHHIDLVDATANVIVSLIPAALDPQLAGRGLDPGYVTTRAGTRLRAWHTPAEPTEAAITHDESTKDVFALTEAADGIGVAAISPYSLLIGVPVLLAIADADAIFCGPAPLATDCSSAQAVHQQEAPYFAPAAELEAYLFPGGYGHSFNYAPNADQFHRTVAAWAERKVGH